MSLAWARRVALGVVAFSVVACVACSGASPGANAAADGGGGASGASVVFDDGDVLTIAPKVSVGIALHVSGDDASVAVWLEGDYADASLSLGDVMTVDRKASLTLHAPSVPATFSIRARAAGTAGSSDARLAVSVSASGFASVRVTSRYDGKRPAPVVTASVFVKSTCADLAAAFTKGQLVDGALAESGALAAPLTIASVPAGSHVSVSVRIKLYAAGCVDLDALAPGAIHDVEVDVLDRAMALDQTDLETTFSFAPDSTDAAAWSHMLDGAIAQAANAFVPQGATESQLLLDAMRAIVPSSSQAAFDANRSQDAWDTRAASWLAQRTPSMRDRAVAWMTAAKPDAMGDLVAHLGPGQSAGYATMKLESLGALDATTAGLAVISPFTWTADAADVVHLGGALHVWPTALTCTAGDARARAAVSGSTDTATALASQIDCAGLSTALVGGGASYPGCASSCTASLCGQALAVMWTGARDASSAGGDDLPIGITASAPALVGDDAEPTAFTGAWVGQVGSANSPYGVFGTKGVAKGLRGSVPH